MVLYIVLLILVTCLILMVTAAIIRQRLIRRRIRIKITNRGNVECKYFLRAESHTGSLEFRFSSGGKELPTQWIIDQEAANTVRQVSYNVAQPEIKKGSGVGNALNRGVSAGGALSSLLTSIGTFLPRGMGDPFLKAGSKVYQGQLRAGYAQQVSNRASYFVPQKSYAPQQAPAPQTEAAIQSQGVRWYVAPMIRPGEALTLELSVRSMLSQGRQIESFRIVSRASEDGCGPVITEEGTVHFRGGFWSHRVWPQIAIFGLCLVFLLITFLLYRAGVLS